MLRIAQFGLGPIGIESLKLLAEQPWAQVVGGIDIDPAKLDQDLASITGEARLADLPVVASFDELAGRGPIDLVLHTAGSKAAQSIGQMMPMVKAGVNVASTCEELLFPKLRAPEEAARLDEVCQRSGARVVGTGVNPGFVMDLLPIVLSGVSRRVDRVWARRVVDATTRRGPLQKKIGSGLAPDEFQSLFQQGKAGHAGFKESAALIAHAMGWPWDDLEETLEPVVADRAIKTDFVSVEPGQTRGLHQVVTARVSGEVKVELDLTMALEEPEPADKVHVVGDPDLKLTLEGGVAGDVATVAALVNVGRRLSECRPGVRLMTDLPAPRHGGE